MKTVFKSLIPKHIKVVLRKIRLNYQLRKAIKISILKPDDIGESVKIIKPETLETITIPEIHDFVYAFNYKIKTPKLELMKYQKAMIFPASDFIVCPQGAVWGKYFYPQFTKITPIDRNLIMYKDKSIFIKKMKKIIPVEVGFSLCGVHSFAWSHFVVQYLPKLYLVGELLDAEEKKITVILPDRLDPQIRELVLNYRTHTRGFEILELQEDEVALCESLYHIENTAWLSENIKDIGPTDGVIPRFVAESMKNNFDNMCSNTGNENLIQNDFSPPKIFLARTKIRNVANYDEIEKYFIQKGYCPVMPHNLSLYEKIRLFQNASCIVGPVGGGFTNLFFCKKGTKILVFSSFQRCIDTYLGFLTSNFGLDAKIIIGTDEHRNDINSSFAISLETIKNVCEASGM